MRSSTTPPVRSSQQSVYCALPGAMRSRSLVRVALMNSFAPAPVTDALPRCETSKTPTESRTAACSASTPPPAYSSGISQPPNSPSLAPSSTCRSWSGEVSNDCMRRTLPCLRYLRSTAPLFDEFDAPLDERIQREREDDFAEDDEHGPEE